MQLGGTLAKHQETHHQDSNIVDPSNTRDGVDPATAGTPAYQHQHGRNNCRGAKSSIGMRTAAWTLATVGTPGRAVPPAIARALTTA
jgi:hypothetical protein